MLLLQILLVHEASSLGEVLWAVNAGGESHTDIHGIRYQKDHLTTGIASGKCANLAIWFYFNLRFVCIKYIFAKSGSRDGFNLITL